MRKYLIIAFILSLCAAGCGYSTKSLLPSHIKTVYIDNFKNLVDTTQEPTNRTGYLIYRPGLEVDIVKSLREKFIFDGNLKVVNSQDQADMAIQGSLIDFRKETLRYDVSEETEEYRIQIIVKIKAADLKKESTVWESEGFIGESTYRTSGAHAVSEDTAISNAIVDLTRRIVERTIETW